MVTWYWYLIQDELLKTELLVTILAYHECRKTARFEQCNV